MKYKRQLQRFSTKELENLFDEYFATTHLSNEILELLSERKKRSFIIEKFCYEFGNNNKLAIIIKENYYRY